MSNLLYFDDLSIADEFVSEKRVVSEKDVRLFAELTGDFTRLHVDEEYAAETPFRKPIAHGLLGLSILAGLSSSCPNMDTAAFLGVSDWKFLAPIYFGDEIHAITKVESLTPKGRKRGHVVWYRELMNQNGEIVQSGRLETLVNKKAKS